MPFTVADIIEVKNFFSAPTDGAINVLHYRVFSVTGANVVTLQQVADQLFEVYTASFCGAISGNTFFHATSAAKIWPLPAEERVLSTAAPEPSTRADAVLLPKQVSAVLTKRSGFAGRKFRGRVYFPFPTEADNTAAGIPEAAYLTKLDAVATVLDDGQNIDDGGANFITIYPVIFHRADHTNTSVIQVLPRPRWATQRRRNNNRIGLP